MRDDNKSKADLIAEIEDLRQQIVTLEHEKQTDVKIQHLVQVSPVMLGTLDHQGCFDGLNLAWEATFGWTIDDLLGRSVLEWVHPEDHDLVQSALTSCIIDKTPIIFRHRFACKDSTYKTVEWAIRDVTESHIFLVVDDITIDLQDEAEFTETMQKFQLITESIHEVFWMATPGITEVLYVSPAYETIWKRTRESLYRDPQSFIRAVHPDDQAKVFAALGTHSKGRWDVEYRMIQPDGNIRFIEDRGFPVFDDDGNLIRMVGSASDITKRKLIETDLRQALEREQELNKLKTRFTSMFSHELRSPLTVILMNVDQITHYQQQLKHEQIDAKLDQIRVQVDRIAKLMDDVLIMGKLDIAQFHFSPNPIELETFCRHIVEEIQYISETHHVEFTSTRLSNLVAVDENLLHSAITNLLSNAIKYSPDQDVIFVELTQDNDWAILHVQDQGIGIPEADQPYLFDTFHRATNVGEILGSGLGLALVKQIVEAHSGTVTFASEVGHGTTFTIKLPLIA